MSTQRFFDNGIATNVAQSIPQGGSEDVTRLHRSLLHFQPITLAEMERVALLDRTDTKLLLTPEQLHYALDYLLPYYRVLEIEGRRQHHYQTLYFDTPDLDFYHQHHNGWRNRYKVRERAYVDSDLTFVEVKHKVRSDRTIKHRRPVPELTTDFGQPAAAFIQAHAPFREDALVPTLWNDFQRITLVSTHRRERVTFDLDLRFRRAYGNKWVALPGVVVAEVKQVRFSYDSDFLREMRYLGVRPTGFSKYCTGVALLYPEVKHNNFKPRMLHLKRVMGGRATSSTAPCSRLSAHSM